MCGIKCCSFWSVIFVWGAVQMCITGVCLYFESSEFIFYFNMESVSIDDFYEIASEKYRNAAQSCWITSICFTVLSIACIIRTRILLKRRN